MGHRHQNGRGYFRINQISAVRTAKHALLAVRLGSFPTPSTEAIVLVPNGEMVGRGLCKCRSGLSLPGSLGDSTSHILRHRGRFLQACEIILLLINAEEIAALCHPILKFPVGRQKQLAILQLLQNLHSTKTQRSGRFRFGARNANST